MASLNNIPVIPVASTGGAADEIWKKYKENSDNQSLNVQQFDRIAFEALMDKRIPVVVDAVVTLLKSSINLI